MALNVSVSSISLGISFPHSTHPLPSQIAFAFSSLLSFYYTFKYDLRPLEPVPKFLLIKSIIFCIFWQVCETTFLASLTAAQGLILAVLVETNVIPVPSGSEYTKKTLTATLQVGFHLPLCALTSLDRISLCALRCPLQPSSTCMPLITSMLLLLFPFIDLDSSPPPYHRPYVDHSSRIIGPYHHSNNLKSIPTVSEAYRHMKISSSSSNSSLPGQQKRYTSNIRRSKDRKARSDSHNSTEELTESLLRNYDEEEGNGEEEEEVVLNNHHPVHVAAYPDLLIRQEKGKTDTSTLPKQKKGKKKEPYLVEEKTEAAQSRDLLLKEDRAAEGGGGDGAGSGLDQEIQFPISSFEVEDPDDQESSSHQQGKKKKKSYLSGKPLVGMYDRTMKRGEGEGGNVKGEVKKDTLAARWLQAQQPKHNEIFNRQDAIENYNVDRRDGSSSAKKFIPPGSQSQGSMTEGEAYETLLDKHFAHSTAVRHFNESMPVSGSSWIPSSPPSLIPD
jgi:hypothetical protein